MLPVQRKTRTQSKKGRSHHALTPRGVVKCANCGTPKVPHGACRECGYVRPGLMMRTKQQANG